MKLLFVGFNAQYINPTNYLLQGLLRLFADVAFFGPGFSSDNELKGGLKSFYDSHGRFDFIFTTTQLAVASDPVATANFYRTYCLTNWGKIDIESFMVDARRFLRQCKQPRIVFALDLDPYAVPATMISELDEFADYIVSLGVGFTKPNIELRYLTQERDIAQKADRIALGLWHDYCQSRPRKFISLGHFVGLNEFDFGPIALRHHSVTVAGQLYYFRKKTMSLLRDDPRINIASSAYRWIFSMLSKVGLNPYSRPLIQTIYRALFTQLLRSSRISITDGGAYEYMVRKFVEIPAAGALLLVRPCAGFEALGFVDGESAVVIDESNMLEQIITLLSDTEKIQVIASHGQSLVWEKHSIQARARQLESALVRISSGNFKGSAWEKGNFVLF